MHLEALKSEQKKIEFLKEKVSKKELQDFFEKEVKKISKELIK